MTNGSCKLTIVASAPHAKRISTCKTTRAVEANDLLSLSLTYYVEHFELTVFFENNDLCEI